MKKSLFLTALASVALASCVNDESNVAMEAPQPLRFDAPVMTTQTRANVMGEMLGVQYDSGESFKVFCISHKEGAFNGWIEAETADEKFWFNQGGEEAKPAGSYWKTDLDHYWPGKGIALAFAAYSPADLEVAGADAISVGATVTYGSTGLKIENFKTQSKSDLQYDLMYSDRLKGLTNESHGKSHVPIKFHHALSSIVFSADENVTGKDYTITDLQIIGKFYSQGTFNQGIVETKADGTNPYSETAGNPTWTKIEANGSGTEVTEKTFTPSFEDFTVGSSAFVFTGGKSALLLIPQEVPVDAKVKLTYVAKTLNGEGDADDIETEYTIDIPLSDFKLIDKENETITEWKMGERYNYRITFGGTPPITFDPSTTDWVNGGVAEFTVK